MASNHTYAQLPSNTESGDATTLENLEWENLDRKRLAANSRLLHLFTLLCGIGIGIIISTVSKPIVGSISQAMEKVQSIPKTQHQVSVDAGFILNPETGEAKCGNSWQDAKSLGCHFDVMASRWYSDDCFNRAILEQMLEEVDFEWYADPQHTQKVSKEVALSGEFDEVFPLHDYHIMHCLYLWRRLHSALVQHRQLDDDVYSYEHTLHCTRLIMGWHKEKNTTTIATSGIPYCRNEPL